MPATEDEKAELNRLLPLVYRDLRSLAARYLDREAKGHSLQTTALVHEAYLRLVRSRGDRAWNDPIHVLAVTARAMRHVLVDHARARRRAKRGAGRERIRLEEVVVPGVEELDDLVELDAALASLAESSSRAAKVVELRFFGGMTTVEVAHHLEVTERTVERDWRYARAWLLRELERGGDAS